MKVTVYAIAKNEERFVERWAASMAEADHICVLDTGSTDGTVEKLKALGVTVWREEIQPWRFDTARNRSMDMIPEETDICVCTDLDEVFRTGWRADLERAWKPGTEQLRYRYIWSFDETGAPGTEFLQEKIHAPGAFRWVHPVHEVLERTDGKNAWPVAVAEEIVLEHHPDPQKSRSGYLALLELSVQERPEDDRNAHYLGREYMFHRRWDEAIQQLRRHLELPTATWAEERCASMRFLSRCYMSKGDTREAMCWAMRAIAEAPELREPWVQAEEVAYAREDWSATVFFGGKAVTITEKSGSYINEEKAWGAYPWDAMAYALYCLGDIAGAAKATEEAIALAPEDERLRNNLAYYRRALE